MKPFARMILVSFLALAAGCVSRINLEHWKLEPCDAALSYCDGREGNITLIEANGKTYLVYERL